MFEASCYVLCLVLCLCVLTCDGRQKLIPFYFSAGRLAPIEWGYRSHKHARGGWVGTNTLASHHGMLTQLLECGVVGSWGVTSQLPQNLWPGVHASQ